jgi:hypothetical protein
MKRKKNGGFFKCDLSSSLPRQGSHVGSCSERPWGPELSALQTPRAQLQVGSKMAASSAQGLQPPPVVAALQRLCRTSLALDSQDARLAELLAEGGKRALLEAAQRLVDEAAGAPNLSTKSCDGTPVTTRVAVRRRLPGGAKVARSGRQGQEVLVKHQFLRCFTGADLRTRVILQDPVQLTHGKTAAAIYAACARD